MNTTKLTNRVALSLDLGTELAGKAIDVANAALKTVNDNTTDILKLGAGIAVTAYGVEHKSTIVTVAGVAYTALNIGKANRVIKDFEKNLEKVSSIDYNSEDFDLDAAIAEFNSSEE